MSQTEFERRRYGEEQIRSFIKSELEAILTPIVHETGALILALEKRVAELEENMNGVIRTIKNEYN